ncbi:unannotated protein [freshwater metagenome]|uniref:Unannotated protein n=1 Tax=freshwater metagenome TaxID=449393 RepID=A0A6J7GJ04_9ZZZZ
MSLACLPLTECRSTPWHLGRMPIRRCHFLPWTNPCTAACALWSLAASLPAGSPNLNRESEKSPGDTWPNCKTVSPLTSSKILQVVFPWMSSLSSSAFPLKTVTSCASSQTCWCIVKKECRMFPPRGLLQLWTLWSITQRCWLSAVHAQQTISPQPCLQPRSMVTASTMMRSLVSCF